MIVTGDVVVAAFEGQVVRFRCLGRRDGRVLLAVPGSSRRWLVRDSVLASKCWVRVDRHGDRRRAAA